jgi:transmembrane sensor
VANANQIEAAAARWHARQDAGELSALDQTDFDHWCAEDPRHLGAYVRLEAVDARLERAAALHGLPETAPSKRRYWIPATAAAAVVAAVFGGVQYSRLGETASQTRVIATHLGEQYRTALNDGSLVDLNTNSRASIDMERSERRVKLDAGEAVFEVAKDAKRPFVVQTALGDVRAVGTVFSVRVTEALK